MALGPGIGAGGGLGGGIGRGFGRGFGVVDVVNIMQLIAIRTVGVGEAIGQGIESGGDPLPKQLQPFAEQIARRSMIVKKAQPLAVECIVRGYLSGSGLKEYKKSQTVCGIKLDRKSVV